MSDIRERFRAFDGLDVPDQWRDIQLRPGSMSPVEPPLTPSLSQRLLVTGVALLLAAASFFVLTKAFRHDKTGPAVTPSITEASPTPHVSAIQWLPAQDLGTVDPQPTSIVSAFGHVWVTGFTGSGPHVNELNGVTGKLVVQIPVAGVPSWEVGGGDMAASSDAVWVGGARYGSQGNADTSVLSRIDPTTGVAQTYPLPGTGVLDVTVDGSTMFAIVTMREGSFAVVQVDPSTGGVVKTVPFDAISARSVIALDGAVWVSERGKGACCGELVAIIPAPGTSPVPVQLSDVRAEPQGADGIMWAPVRVTGGTSEWSGLAQIDPRTGETVQRWDLGRGIAFDIFGIGDGAWVLAGQPCCADVIRFDAALGESTVGAHTKGTTPIALAADAHDVWVLTYEGHLLRVPLPD
jgi:hypothetical protein